MQLREVVTNRESKKPRSLSTIHIGGKYMEKRSKFRRQWVVLMNAFALAVLIVLGAFMMGGIGASAALPTSMGINLGQPPSTYPAWTPRPTHTPCPACPT